MTAVVPPRSPSRPRRRARRATRRVEPAFARRAPPRRDLEGLAAGWQRALDAGDSALRAARDELPAAYLARHRRALDGERREAAGSLVQLARATGASSLPWLSRVPMSNRLLGLADSVEACVYDLDGVLTDSGLVHAAAWGTVLDDFLAHLTGETGRHFVTFDRELDYRRCFEGRSRTDGVHAFLESAGIRIPEGHAGDDPAAGTIHGLAARKGEVVARLLERRGVTARPGARRYLEAAGRAGVGRGVLSASANTLAMLEVAGLASLVETCVDAGLIQREGARTPPFPDLLLAACKNLDVDPASAVAFTGRPAGVAAGLAAGMQVVGVGDGRDADVLRGFGAELVVPSLAALLDRSVLEPSSMSEGVAR